MKCPNCKTKLPLYSILLREYRCKGCNGKISSSVALSVTAALMGLAVSGLFSAGFIVFASVAFVVILVVLAIITPFNIKCTFDEDGQKESDQKES